MYEIIIKNKISISNKEIPVLLGGFGENEPILSDKSIAITHDMRSADIRRRINDNINRFAEDIDIIDLKNVVHRMHDNPLLDNMGYTTMEQSKSKNLYIFSRRGYLKLIKIMNTDRAWEVYEEMLDKYFSMEQRLKSNQTSVYQHTQPTQNIIQILQNHNTILQETSNLLITQQTQIQELKQDTENKLQETKEEIKQTKEELDNLKEQLKNKNNWSKYQQNKIEQILAIENKGLDKPLTKKEVLENVYDEIKIDLKEYTDKYMKEHKLNIVPEIIDVMSLNEELQYIFETALDDIFFVMRYVYNEDINDDYYKQYPMFFKQITDNIYQIRGNTNLLIKKRKKYLDNKFSLCITYNKWKTEIKKHITQILKNRGLTKTFMSYLILGIIQRINQEYHKELSQTKDVNNLLTMIYTSKYKRAFEDSLLDIQ